MKKILLSLIITLLTTTSAHALPGFIDVFVTNGMNTTPVTSIDDGQTPFIYMLLEIPPASLAATNSAWNAPDGLSSYTSNTGLGTNTQRWSGLSNWDSVKQSGDWHLFVNYFDSQGNNQVRELAFTSQAPVPEPSTLGLMLMGTIPMFLRRKKIQS